MSLSHFCTTFPQLFTRSPHAPAAPIKIRVSNTKLLSVRLDHATIVLNHPTATATPISAAITRILITPVTSTKLRSKIRAYLTCFHYDTTVSTADTKGRTLTVHTIAHDQISRQLLLLFLS